MRFAKELQPQECVEGETVQFECKVTKETPVTWYKDDEPLADSDRHQLVSAGLVHKLIIAQAKLDDEAVYTVTSGPAKSTASLLVDGIYLLHCTYSMVEVQNCINKFYIV